ncbi:anti-anti-sigma factor [Mycobacterium simiae]|uniref:Anti-anti-sigma factor n=1 Tax=Mycobacterium simiae TaxID=1784 RepID=A0A5B1BNR6_MYCSI|nr:MEDS domain-containing protein [Mycobacterium simiae]KAA1249445.1 anti-anti-sigma factor [Mycobacterium simiae]
MTRKHGVVASAAGLIPFGHLGWGYADRADFYARAAEYIADGLAQNQRVDYVGDATREQLWAELAAMAGLCGRLNEGNIAVTPTMEFYAVAAGTDVVDPETALAARVVAVEQAIQDGYTGFRAVADCTAVARRPEQRDAFGRFEFLIDQKMAVLPVSALCAYDLSQLADGAAELLCLHPYVSCQGAPSFQLYAEPGADFALSGEIDASCGQMFADALGRILSQTAEKAVIIDARGLEFIGHRQLITLDRYAQAHARTVVLRAARRTITRLAGLLSLTNVRVEPPLQGFDADGP